MRRRNAQSTCIHHMYTTKENLNFVIGNGGNTRWVYSKIRRNVAQICVPTTYLKCWKLFIIKSWRPESFSTGMPLPALNPKLPSHRAEPVLKPYCIAMPRKKFFNKTPLPTKPNRTEAKGPGSPREQAITVAGMIVIYAMAIIIRIFARQHTYS